MKISVGKGASLSVFETRTVGKEELLKIIVSNNYSLSTFKNNHRKIENFISADAIALDIDDTMTIDRAKEIFKDYTYVLAPSRNHQKIKVTQSGVEVPPCDRFRIIFPLEIPITDPKVFYNTWFSVSGMAEGADEACKDPSRFFYPSQNIECINTGIKLKPVLNAPIAPQSSPIPEPIQKGKLAYRTLKFLLMGAPQGQKHEHQFKSARDANEQGYTKEWFWAAMEDLSKRTGDNSYIDNNAKKTIEDAFNKDPRHDKRVEPKAYNLVKAAKLMEGKSELDWTVHKLLSTGGVSILAGSPKIGKSTLVRQLITSVVKGHDFLKRETKQGPVIYLAFEEQEEVLNNCFKHLGIKEKDELYIHVGAAKHHTKKRDLIELLRELKPRLVVIDTMSDFMDAQINDYNEIKKRLSDLRTIAREENCHICLVHHSKKPFQGRDGKNKLIGADGILGSQAILGGVDCYMIIESDGSEDRYITSGGRDISNWHQMELIFDHEKLTFKLGNKRTEGEYY